MRWFLAVLLLLVAAVFLESSLLAYATYVLLGLLLISRWLARRWIGQLSAARAFLRAGRGEEPVAGPEGQRPVGLTAEVGERVVVRVRVHNNGRLPVPWVLLEDLLPRAALDRRFPRLKVKGKRLQIAMLRAGGTLEMRYQLECLGRGYYQVGPLVLESGDLFGLHRRHRVLTEPGYLLVYPRIVPVIGYDLASRRPIGDVRLTHRLYEDPTRIAGVRRYEAGDPLNRVHWRATARTGMLHSKVHEPSTLSGASILLDFHEAGYHSRGEPFRSELSVTAAASLANAVSEMGQQVGLVTNGRDASDRLRLHPAADSATGPKERELATRQAARQAAGMVEQSDRLRPLRVETRRGVEQLQHIREVLARVELTAGLTFADLVIEATPRLPRDATILAVLPDVPVESAVALGNLRRHGLAVTVVLVALGEEALERSYARLVAEGVRDIRHLADEAALPDLCRRQVEHSAPYDFASIGSKG
jgi:uncharacterized protein (DUF58 family)